MKKINRLLSWLLVIAMLTGMCPAWATGEGGVPEENPNNLPVMCVDTDPRHDAPNDHPKPDGPGISLPIRHEGQYDLQDTLVERPENDAQTMTLTETVSGYCGGEGDGTNLAWTLTTDGTLTISGDGAMADWPREDQPWGLYSHDIISVIIEDGVTNIGEMAFAWFYTNLTNVEISNSVAHIGDGAFIECSGLVSIVIPDGVTSIGECVFSWCSGLTDITIPNSVVSIGGDTFAYCTKLVSIALSNNMTSIDESLFYGCRSLTKVVIPDNITTIGEYAFDYCNALTTIYYTGTEEQWNTIEIGDYNDPLLNANIIFEWNGEESEDAIASGTCGENLTWTLTEDGTLTISGEGEMECYKWNSPPWYDYAEQLAAIVIQNGVTSIGESSFSSCEALTSVAIGDSVTSIGEWAFSYCSALTSVTIPDSVTSIGEFAFYACSSMTSVEIGDSVTSIGERTFCDCDSLTSVTIPDSVTSIGKYAFYACSSLMSITIPDSVTSIGAGAFFNCSALTSVTIPDSVTSIGDRMFCQCYSLTNVTISDSVTSIDVFAFYSCSSLTNIIVSENNPNFCDMDGVLFTKDMATLILYPAGKTATAYEIPDSVTSIGERTFCDCDSLTSVTIPDSITSIGDSTFSWCNGLTTVYYYGSKEQWNAIDIGTDNDPLLNANIIFEWSGEESEEPEIPEDAIASGTCGENLVWYLTEGGALTITGTGAMNDYTDYSTDTPVLSPWSDYLERITSIIIENGVSSIGDFAFLGCYNSATIEIPNTVTSIGDAAFAYCTSITRITIPDSVTSIGTSVFYACENLTSATLSENVASIGEWMFAYCTSLSSIAIPDNVTNIGYAAFYYCTSLANIALSDSLTGIGDWAFGECHSVETITIPKDVTSISNRVFFGCSNLGSITLPEGLLSIGISAFYECGNLKGITIPDSVTSIGDYAFYDCSSIESIVIPDGITIIGQSVFYECDRLISVEIPNSVTSIGSLAFAECRSLASIEFPNSVTNIGDYAFSNCNSLTHVKISGFVRSIGTLAFNHCDWLEEISVDYDNPYYSSENGILFDKNKTTLLCYPAGKTQPTYVVPARVTNIILGAFTGCNSLAEILVSEDNANFCSVNGVLFDSSMNTLICYPAQKTDTVYEVPFSVTYIGRDAFTYCNNLVTVTIPDSVTSIGTHIFMDCTNLASINIPDSVTSISWAMFLRCQSLVNIEIPDSVTTIDGWAFRDCTSLTTATIPDSVINIVEGAFNGCNALATVYYSGTEEQWQAIEIGEYNYPLLNAEVIFEWSGESEIIAAGYCGGEGDGTNLTWTLTTDGTLTVSGVGEMRCYCDDEDEGGETTRHYEHQYAPWWFYSDRIISVVIEDHITAIGMEAFLECRNIKDVTIGSSVSSIGYSAFWCCDSLTTVYYTGTEDQWNTITIDRGNDPLLNAEIIFEGNGEESEEPEEPEEPEIPEDAVASGECGENLIWYLTAGGVLVISGEGEMKNYSSGTMPWHLYRENIFRIVILDGVINVGTSAFDSCSHLRQIEIPVSVTVIGDSAFHACENLKNVYYTGILEQWYEVSLGYDNDVLYTAMIRCINTVFPSGYDFFNDSYNFENYGDEIPKNYFTTIYKLAPGTILYQMRKDSSKVGLCFGMAYTTAAIYQGYPNCSAIVTMEGETILKPRMCENIRDIINRNLTTSPAYISTFSIRDYTITIDDYIKYAFIYQWSSEVANSSAKTWDKPLDLYAAVKTMTDNGMIGVTIGMTHGTISSDGSWTADTGHRVLAVGYEGRDILIDDPNNPYFLERLTINEDGTWDYSGTWKPDGVNSENSRIRYQTDVLRPYEILLTSRKIDTYSMPSGDATTHEIYIENTERLDANNMLLYIEDTENVVLPANTVEIIDDIGTGNGDTDVEYSGNLYWVLDTDSVSLSDLSGEQNSIIIANDSTIISVEGEALTEITGTINEATQSIDITTNGDSTCSVSYTTVTSEKDIELRISGTASEDGISVQNSEDGLVIEGLSSGTIELLHDDAVQESIEFSDEDQSFTVSYDNTGEDSEIDATADEVAHIQSVQGVALDKDQVTLTSIGATETLTATITPNDATNQNVTWTSSDPSVATVSEDGVVTAVANGTTTITVTTEDGGFTATCEVTVSVASNVLMGDVTGDGKVNVGDAVKLLKAIASKTTDEFSEDVFTAADVTRDGKINVGDAVKLLKAIASKTTDKL